jgi:iron complex transport system substrate-binding protein
VSLLPSATEVVYALGLGDHVVGVSHACDYPEGVRDKPCVSRPRFDPAGLTGAALDAAVRQALRQHGSVYEIDTAALHALAPDLVLTQGICDVCAVPERDARASAAELRTDATVLALDAHDLAAIRAGIVSVGTAAGARPEAEACVARLDRRMAAVRARVGGRAAPRVLALEWLDPPYVPGHWVPELVTQAGGRLVAGVAGQPSRTAAWPDLAGLDPDVLVVMPCGMGLTEARQEADRADASLRAVAARAVAGGRAYVVDASSYFSRSGPRVADGVELLAALLHDGAPLPALAGRAARWP